MSQTIAISLHLAIGTMAFGIAAGYSLAMRFWPGVIIGTLAVFNEYAVVAWGEISVSLIAQEPLTVIFAYFIVQAAAARAVDGFEPPLDLLGRYRKWRTNANEVA